MNIAFDIDGVITDLQRFMFDYGYKYFKTPVKNPNSYYTSEVFGFAQDKDDDFWCAFGKYYFTKYPVRDGVVEVINNLKNEGYNIYFITHRNEKAAFYCSTTMDKYKEIVKDWFKFVGLSPENIIHCDGSKLPHCLQNNISVIVEDKPENVLELSTEIKVICFDAYYNQHVSGDNIMRCYSMFEAYDLIKNIQK